MLHCIVGFFLDLKESLLFGTSLQAIHRLPARRLLSTNAKVVDKFNTLFEAQLQRHNMGPRIQQLYETTTYPMGLDQQNMYEKT